MHHQQAEADQAPTPLRTKHALAARLTAGFCRLPCSSPSLMVILDITAVNHRAWPHIRRPDLKLSGSTIQLGRSPAYSLIFGSPLPVSAGPRPPTCSGRRRMFPDRARHLHSFPRSHQRWLEAPRLLFRVNAAGQGLGRRDPLPPGSTVDRDVPAFQGGRHAGKALAGLGAQSAERARAIGVPRRRPSLTQFTDWRTIFYGQPARRGKRWLVASLKVVPAEQRLKPRLARPSTPRRRSPRNHQPRPRSSTGSPRRHAAGLTSIQTHICGIGGPRRARSLRDPNELHIDATACFRVERIADPRRRRRPRTPLLATSRHDLRASSCSASLYLQKRPRLGAARNRGSPSSRSPLAAGIGSHAAGPT